MQEMQVRSLDQEDPLATRWGSDWYTLTWSGLRISPAISFFKNDFIYLFMAVQGLRRCVGFSPVAASGSRSLVAVCESPIAVPSLVEAHGP